MILPDFIAESFQFGSKVDSSGDLCIPLKGHTSQYHVCNTRMKKECIRFCHLDWSEKKLYKGVITSHSECVLNFHVFIVEERQHVTSLLHIYDGAMTEL